MSHNSAFFSVCGTGANVLNNLNSLRLYREQRRMQNNVQRERSWRSGRTIMWDEWDPKYCYLYSYLIIFSFAKVDTGHYKMYIRLSKYDLVNLLRSRILPIVSLTCSPARITQFEYCYTCMCMMSICYFILKDNLAPLCPNFHCRLCREQLDTNREKKEEIWLSPMTKAPTPTEMSKGQSDNTNNATKKFD